MTNTTTLLCPLLSLAVYLLGKLIIIAALDGTFQRKPFANVMELIPLAESVVKLSAVCMVCNRDAAFSKRLSDETEVEVCYRHAWLEGDGI
jgi:thymidine kinase